MIKKCIFFVLIVALSAIFIYGCDIGYDYEGDGEIDRGILVYPTFRIRFERIPININSLYKYRFKGVPNDDMMLRFELHLGDNEKLSKHDIKHIMNLISDTKICVSIELSENHSISTGLRSFAKHWTLSAYGKRYYFWNNKFTELYFDNEGWSTLVISVFQNLKFSRQIYIVPVLEGGGLGKGDVYRP